MKRPTPNEIPSEENEDEDDGYLDPNDLEIIDDENWNPSDEDILSYAMKLGFDIENDPDELFEIAYYYLKYPLPPGWRRAIYKETKELMYINMKDGEIEIATEIEDMARQTYEEKKAEMQRKAASPLKPEAKVVPNKKIPPIGGKLAPIKQHSNNSSCNSIKVNDGGVNVSPGKSNEKVLNLSDGNNSLGNLSENESEEESPSAFFDRKKKEIDTIKNKMTKHNEYEENDIDIKSHNDNSDISFTDNSELNVESEPITKISPKGLYEKKKKNDNSDNKRNVEKLKNEYFELKLQELKEFENNIRESYAKSKEEYKIKKELLKDDIEKENEAKLGKEIQKIQKQFKEKMKLYQSQLENSNKKEYDKYYNEIEKKIQNEKKSTNEDNEKYNNLLEKKKKLLDMIEKQKEIKKENESKANELKETFDKNKQILNEKNKLQRNNITKEYEIKIKNIQIEKENEYNKYISDLKANNAQNTNLKSSQMNLSNFNNDLMKSNFFENYQKALDDEYEINCKSIKQDFILNQSKEINNFTSSMQIETNDKIKQYTSKLSELESEYFTSLSQIRESSKENNTQNTAMLQQKFDSALNDYEALKMKIVSEGDDIVKIVSTVIRSSILSESSVSSAELKVEEALLNKADNQMLRSQRAKTSYDIAESDYIYKTFALEYIIDIANDINSFVIENPITNNITNITEAINGLVTKAKGKLEQYKFKYNQEKGNKLYQFLTSLNDSSNPASNEDINGINRNIKLISTISKSKIPSERYNNNPNIESTAIPNNNQIEDEHEEINSDNEMNNNNNNNDINCYVIDNNISIPLLSDYTIHQFDNDELSLYTDITVFLKNEYTKIEEINNVEENGEKRTKLNLLILDKIKIYAEDTFNFIAMNVENQNNRRFFKEKLQLLISNINDYKKNFYIEPAKRNKIDDTVIDKPNCITKKSFSYINNNNTVGESQNNGKTVMSSVTVPPSSKINGAFDTFYYNKNMTMSSPFANEYFNYKKNRYEIDSKLTKSNIYYIK